MTFRRGCKRLESAPLHDRKGPGARSRRLRWTNLCAAALAVSLLVISAAVAAPEPERHDTTPTGWGWYSSVTEANLNSFIDEFGMRLLDIEVIDGAAPKFAAALVHNDGVFERPSWHWYFGLTFNQLTNLDAITSGRERALDVDNYMVGSQRRYAVVTVNNQGDFAKAWWWYFKVSKTFIKNHLEGRRIIDIDRRPGSSRYNVVMIANTGEDQRGWWYYYSRTPAQIKDRLNDKKARLVDIERDGNGKFTVVMVRRQGEYWWWYYGLRAGAVKERLAQNGARLIDIERYTTSKGPRYAVIMLNNLNNLSTRVREIMRPGAKKAAFGFYLKQVGGPVYAGLQTKKVFEPASMIKVLHNLHAMRAVQAGTAQSGENITWFVRPSDPARYPGDTDYSDDKNKCAYQADGTAIVSNQFVDPLGNVILRQMMERSDNRTTDAVVNRFGFTAINNTADFVGMTDTQLNHRIGCAGAASPQPFQRNELTLSDAGLLYEGVANGSLLGTGAFRDLFYDYMVNGTGGWKAVVDQEAAALGLPQSVADDFRAAMRTANKGGSYTNTLTCPSGVSGVCRLLRRTGGGILTLPFKPSPTAPIQNVDYFYGSFVDGEFQCGTNCDGEIALIGTVRTKAHEEMLRPRIRAALQTWAP